MRTRGEIDPRERKRAHLVNSHTLLSQESSKFSISNVPGESTTRRLIGAHSHSCILRNVRPPHRGGDVDRRSSLPARLGSTSVPRHRPRLRGSEPCLLLVCTAAACKW